MGKNYKPCNFIHFAINKLSFCSIFAARVLFCWAFFFLFCSKIFSIKKKITNYLHFQGETDTETYYDTDGDDRGYASLDESAARGKRKEDPGYLSMDELHQPPPRTRKRRKIKNADGKQEVA